MSEETPDDFHKQNSNERNDNGNTAIIHSYYDEKFSHLSNSAKSALKIIELECETIRDLLKACESSNDYCKGS